MRKLIVSEKYNNKKLNTFILDNFKSLNQNVFYKALRKKDIRINDKRISENCLLRNGDEVKIYITDDIIFSTKINLQKIYEDEKVYAF